MRMEISHDATQIQVIGAEYRCWCAAKKVPISRFHTEAANVPTFSTSTPRLLKNFERLRDDSIFEDGLRRPDF